LAALASSSITSVTFLRSANGFRLIWMRPLLSVVLVPSTPMNEDRLSTAGFFEDQGGALADAAPFPRRTPLGGFGHRLDLARVLHREEALGDDDKEYAGDDQRGDGDRQGQAAPLEHPVERALVEADDAHENVSDHFIEAALIGGLLCLKSFAHSMGVSVREMNAEMRMVALRVTANSRNRRPVMSPMNSSGMSTAMSDTVRDMMVKPICSAPLSAAARGFSPCFHVARDVLDHHDGIVHHEAGRNGERHQREIVEAEAERVHGAEGADQRQGHGDAGDDGGREGAQEDEYDHHHERDAEQEFEFHVGHGGAHGGGAVRHDGDFDDGRDGGA
jgi:hypothetical protein